MTVHSSSTCLTNHQSDTQAHNPTSMRPSAASSSTESVNLRRRWRPWSSTGYVLLSKSQRPASTRSPYHLQCPHESRSCEIQYPLNFITPFQETSTIFQRLKSLQLGPDLCHICLLAVLHLFCSKRFQIDAQESGPNGRLTRGHHHLGFNRREGDTVDSAAAPNLSHLCVYLDAFGGRHSNTQGDLSALTRHIAHPEKIQMLQLWLHELQELGGMSSGGNILHLAPRNTKDVEKELTDWAEQELAKQKSAQDVLLAKFAAQAKSVLPKPRRTGVDSKDGSTVSEAAAESDETDSDEVNAKGEVDDKPASPDPSSSRHSRSTGTSSDSDGLLRRKATASSLTYEGCLEIIAKTFPNLVGLSLLRRRQLRPAILEGVTSLDKFGQSFVEPLAKLQHLRHLDLGLAVVTKSEVVDFPSGLSLSNTRHGRKIAKDVDSALQALKRRKYTLDMDRARAEGDKWRKAILDRYVDASADSPDEPEVDRSHDDASRAEASASPSRDDTDVKWPKTLRSGHLIMPDLENRVRGNGLMVPWWVEGQKVVVGEPVRMRL